MGYSVNANRDRGLGRAHPQDARLVSIGRPGPRSVSAPGALAQLGERKAGSIECAPIPVSNQSKQSQQTAAGDSFSGKGVVCPLSSSFTRPHSFPQSLLTSSPTHGLAESTRSTRRTDYAVEVPQGRQEASDSCTGPAGSDRPRTNPVDATEALMGHDVARWLATATDSRLCTSLIGSVGSLVSGVDSSAMRGRARVVNACPLPSVEAR